MSDAGEGLRLFGREGAREVDLDVDLADPVGPFSHLPAEIDLHPLEIQAATIGEVDEDGADAGAQGGHQELGGRGIGPSHLGGLVTHELARVELGAEVHPLLPQNRRLRHEFASPPSGVCAPGGPRASASSPGGRGVFHPSVRNRDGGRGFVGSSIHESHGRGSRRRALERTAQQASQYEMRGHRLEFLGVCRRCRTERGRCAKGLGGEEAKRAAGSKREFDLNGRRE